MDSRSLSCSCIHYRVPHAYARYFLWNAQADAKRLLTVIQTRA